MQSILLPVAITGLPIVLLFTFFIILESKRKKKLNLLTKPDSLSEGDRQIAIREALRRISSNPRDTVATRKLADLYYWGEEYQKAFQYYKILMKGMGDTNLESANDLYLNYGVTAMKCQDWDTAYNVFIMAKKKFPDNLDFWVNLGITFYMQKRYSSAIATFKHVLKISPAHRSVMKYMGQGLFHLKLYYESLYYLKKAAGLFPDDTELMYTLAQCEYEEGHTDSALIHFQKLKSHSPWGVYACLYLGHIYSKRKHWKEAIESYLLGLNFENIEQKIQLELKYSLAKSYCYTNQLKEGIAVAQEVSSLNSEYKDIKSILDQCTALNTDNNLRVYLKSSITEFLQLANRIIRTHCKITKRTIIKLYEQYTSTSNYIELQGLIETSTGENNTLFCFIRNEGQTGELFIREFYSRMKEKHAVWGMCMTPGYYSIEAKHFTEARSIELLDKNLLFGLLKRCR